MEMGSFCVVTSVLADIVPSDSGRAKNANGNNFTVGFLEADTRDEPRTGYTTPDKNNALAMLFINFRLACYFTYKLEENTENCDMQV
ncbi:unnamed protein product [Arctia plantaginis]|uniref:Uncharacterized protein n=1 Tax=Arctia plantaginis TaxID=874455 RepID=A0A8S1B015_ARCPL|nr:unnamed protein product [Arctia plantaginis]CAB3254589.1 unnamed protein product [Arctia plantaginis]